MSEILLEINGTQYTNFQSATIGLQFDAVSNWFDFVAVTTRRDPLPFKLGEECVVLVDGIKKLTGFIEALSVSYDSGRHNVTFSGRSKTGDLVDSMIDTLEINPPASLSAVISTVLQHIGSDIKVIDAVGGLEDFNAAEDLLSPEVGENAFEFVEKLARKRQVLLTTNGDGDIVITRSGTSPAPIGLLNEIDGDSNNIEAASADFNSTERFRRYVVKSQLNTTAINLSGSVSAADIVDQKSDAVIDREIRASRQLVLQAESTSSDDQNQKRAQWEANIRKARSVVYQTTVPNFSYNGMVWAPNQIASVKDDFSGINAQMLINAVTFTLDNSGASTSLSLIDKNAYTLELNEPPEGDKVGEGFTAQFN